MHTPLDESAPGETPILTDLFEAAESEKPVKQVVDADSTRLADCLAFKAEVRQQIVVDYIDNRQSHTYRKKYTYLHLS